MYHLLYLTSQDEQLTAENNANLDGKNRSTLSYVNLNTYVWSLET